MDRINFSMARALKDACIIGHAEQSYRFFTKRSGPDTRVPKEIVHEGRTYREVLSPWPPEIWDGNSKSVSLHATSKQQAELSNRFTDSWDDELVGAYTAVELTQFDPDLKVGFNDNPNEIAAELLRKKEQRAIR